MRTVDSDPFKITLLVILCLTAALPGLLAHRDFWVEDEARYAEVVQEMREEGRWLVPHLNGHIYPDKPPLYFWCVAAITCLTGKITPFSFLLVSWLAAVGCILVTYFFAAALRDSLTALLSGLILLSSLLFLTAVQIVRMDMLFAFFIGLSLYCFYRGFQEKRRGYYCLFYLFSAAAVLTKGPLGFAFTFLPAAAFLWLHPRPGAWKQWLRHIPACSCFWGLSSAGCWLPGPPPCWLRCSVPGCWPCCRWPAAITPAAGLPACFYRP